MAEEKGGGENLEIGTKGVKVPVGFLARTIAPERVARAEAIQALTASATAKIGRGEALTPEEHAVFARVMAPVFKKAERVTIIEARAAEILTSEPKLLSAPSLPEGKPTAPPPEAWRDRWVAGAELASDDHVEEMWAQILAGELSAPGSFSFKTLSVLKDIDTRTAETFVRLLGFLMRSAMVPSWGAFEDSYVKHGVRYISMLELADAGLLHFERSSMNGDPKPPQFVACGGGIFVKLDESHVNVPVHLLTAAGRQLAKIATPTPNAGTLNALGAWFRDQYLSVEVGLRSGDLKVAELRPWLAETLTVDDAGVVHLADPRQPGPDPDANI